MAETGVGTVAAGVAKAYADYVLIAGHNGGTGASPLSSIKHAGSPWELGLAEAQATLVRNGLRHRIEVRTDGGLKTGRDVVIAALLGAESYGFGTAPLVAIGLRHGAPVPHQHLPHRHRHPARGPARQVQGHAGAGHRATSPCWRRRCGGSSPRMGVAHASTRSSAATICSQRVERPDVPRAQMLDLSLLLAPPRGRRSPEAPAAPTEARNDRPGVVSLDTEILDELEPYLESGLPFSGSYPIHNHHLAVGARVAGADRRARTATPGLPPGAVRLRFTGSAGQSFGAFTCRGMHLELEGEANDYVGKGLSGGEITIRPFRRAAYADVVAPAPDHRQHGPLRRHRRASSSPRARRATASRCATPARSR